MAAEARDTRVEGQAAAAALLARVRVATRAAERIVAARVTDFFIPAEARLDDRTHALVAAMLTGAVDAVEAAIRTAVMSRARALGRNHVAERIAAMEPALGTLYATGLLNEPPLMAELIRRARETVLAQALPGRASDDPDRPSLLARLTADDDPAIAAAAVGLLDALQERRLLAAAAPVADLPAEICHRLAWQVAAALRRTAGPDTETIDPLLPAAVRSVLGGHDEGRHAEAAASRLAMLLPVDGDAGASLLIDALDDRQLLLFLALLAHRMGIAIEPMRAVLDDAGPDRLWVALRAAALDRADRVRIGAAFASAWRLDDAALVDAIDAIDAVSVQEARDALAAMTLDPVYRAAVERLEDA